MENDYRGWIGRGYLSLPEACVCVVACLWLCTCLIYLVKCMVGFIHCGAVSDGYLVGKTRVKIKI